MVKKLPVEGMSCQHCKSSIETAVKQLEGVKEVTADYKEGFVIINYEENKIALDKLINEIEELGYEVKL